MKRTFMNTPGDTVTVTVSSATGIGKTQLAEVFADFFRSNGLSAKVEDSERDGSSTVIATYTTGEAYIQGLDPHERETLRRHLDALGYEL